MNLRDLERRYKKDPWDFENLIQYSIALVRSGQLSESSLKKKYSSLQAMLFLFEKNGKIYQSNDIPAIIASFFYLKEKTGAHLVRIENQIYAIDLIYFILENVKLKEKEKEALLSELGNFKPRMGSNGIEIKHATEKLIKFYRYSDPKIKKQIVSSSINLLHAIYKEYYSQETISILADPIYEFLFEELENSKDLEIKIKALDAIEIFYFDTRHVMTEDHKDRFMSDVLEIYDEGPRPKRDDYSTPYAKLYYRADSFVDNVRSQDFWNED